jgi:hypothetical protein
MNTIYIAFIIGMFVGLIVGNREFRTKVISMLSGIRAQPFNMSSNSNVKYYARDGGWHYHIKSCRLLSGQQFQELGYKEVDASYILYHHLKPDGCIDRRS